MRTLIDFDTAPAFAIPAIDARGEPTVREAMLLEGPQGWGEFGPPVDCDDAEVARWLTAAAEPGTVGWPDPLRGRVPIAAPVPAVGADRAHAMAASSGCRAADVTVVGTAGSLAGDVARVTAVRDAIGATGALRCIPYRPWGVDTAVRAIEELADAAGGLEFVEHPCRTIEELAAVHRTVGVRIAVDASVVDLAGWSPAALADAADLAVLRCGPLGGVRRALRVAEATGLPCTVGSAGETSVGLAAGLALAGVLPQLRFACGLGTGLLRGGDVVAGRSLIPADGHLPVAPMPAGPDRALLDRFAITDPARVTWWRDRLRRAVGS
ncbi:o-succinylbenzoate synthase [Mycobacterium sp. NPDC050551]|uniref:o-succinylbenzoate synthase n=1 Tax=Mycobacterium sp. NPDC050551 TaxID=3155407 RepID=UPI0034448E63